MSETSETKGRCRSELDMSGSGGPVTNAIADAIDRLAADVAAIKAKVDAISDVAHLLESDNAWVKLVEEQRDAAIRERDEARAEAQRIQDEADDQEQTDKVKRLNAEIEKMHHTLMNRTWERDEARAEVERLKESRDAANRLFGAKQAKVERLRKELDDREQTEQVQRLREANETLHRKSINYIHDRDQYRRERDQERAEVERLRGELAARPAANSPGISDSSPAAPQPAGQGISPGLLETQPTQNAAPAAGWLTDEERHILGAHLQSLRDQRRAMERGGQTLGYSADPCGLKREADVIDNLLTRAGSPPVVEVPMISRRDVPMQNEALAYRDAMNKAGVKWKEVPRE